MSSRRCLNPRPPIHATTSNPAGSAEPPVALNGSQVLNTRNFIPSSSVIFSDLSLDYHLRIEFTRDDKIRRLMKFRHALGAPSFPKANSRVGQFGLDCELKDITNQFAYRIPMAGERPAKEPFIQQHRVRDANSGKARAAESPPRESALSRRCRSSGGVVGAGSRTILQNNLRSTLEVSVPPWRRV